MAQRRASQGGQCPSYSVCWARCVRRSEPALTSRSRTWRCGNNSCCFAADRSDRNSGASNRLFWVWLSHQWSGWREALHVVRPETVIRWHRQAFRAFWTWKSRLGRVGRPRVGSELADLVRTMALANPALGLATHSRRVAQARPRSLAARVQPPGSSFGQRQLKLCGSTRWGGEDRARPLDEGGYDPGRASDPVTYEHGDSNHPPPPSAWAPSVRAETSERAANPFGPSHQAVYHSADLSRSPRTG